MNRRAFLSTAAAGGLSAITGCLRVAAPRADEERRPTGRKNPPPSAREADLPVPRWDLDLMLPRDAIPAITEPRFADRWRDVEPSLRLADDVPVVGVERGDEARAYPLSILDTHEIVNDDFRGPLLVTYCPLCGSGVVAEREVDGRETTFGVSGYLWRSDLVMYDRATESLWSQLLATAIRGPQTGDTLGLVPSSLATWGAWRATHPETQVLLPPPLSKTIDDGGRTYDASYYARYAPPDGGQIVGHGATDGELSGYTLVIGIEANGVERAYPLPRVEPRGVVNDVVGDLPVVVAVARGGTLVAYERRIGGDTLRFRPATGPYMRGGGSRFQLLSGRAVNGPYRGRGLNPATEQSPMFWSAWEAFHPGTTAYGANV